MYGKATFIKVNQLRYDFLSQKYQGTSVQVLIAFNGIVCLLVKLYSFSYLQSFTLNTYSKSPTIWNSYQFPNVPSHEWQNLES